MKSISCYFFVAAAGFVLLSACTPDPSGSTLSANPTERVCQLTGDKDWLTRADTTSQSETNFGLRGTDGGYPVEYGNRMALFFGDSRFTRTDPPQQVDLGPESLPPDDAIGWVTTQTPPTPSQCLDLTINHDRNHQQVVVSPVVVGPFPIKQGLFNVPTGGVSVKESLYAFFWTDHCLDDKPHPCPNTATLNKIGRGVLARYNDKDMTFVDPVALPRDFVSTIALDTNALSRLPKEQHLGVFVFAVPSYRDSVPYLAYAPRDTFADPTSWKFFIGRAADGRPIWASYETWMERGLKVPPPGRPELFDASGAERCVGEFSMTWIQPLNVWLMLYNCGTYPDRQILARIASAPWGPWSQAIVLLDPKKDNNGCQLLWRKPGKGNGCDDRLDDWEKYEDKRGITDGDFYAPYVMDRYTTRVQTNLPFQKQAMVYWLLSTYNPYQVTVMKTKLTVDAFPTAATVSNHDQPPRIKP